MKRKYTINLSTPTNEDIFFDLLKNIKQKEAIAFLVLHYKAINLNKIFVEGFANGYYYLTFTYEGHQILLKNPELLKNANFNAGPSEGPKRGTNGYYYLAATQEGRQILLNTPELLENANFNAGPSEGPNKGTNGYYNLAATQEGQQLLLNNPELLKKANFNTGPSAKPEKSIFTSLISNDQFKLFFENNLEVFETITWPTLKNSLTTILSTKITGFLLKNGKIPWEKCVELSKYQTDNSNNEIIDMYKNHALAANQIENESWNDLYALLKKETWLIETRYHDNGDSLLHRLVKKINNYNQYRLINFIEKMTHLLDLLEPCKTLINENQETPALIADNEHLREKLRTTNNFQKNLECYLLNHADLKKLIQDFLNGLYCLPANGSIKYLVTNPLNQNKELKVSSDLEEIKIHLMELMNQIYSYDHLLDEIALFSLKIFIEGSQNNSCITSFKPQPPKQLSNMESKCIEKIMTNLDSFNSYAFNLAKNSNKQAKGIPTTNFFSPKRSSADIKTDQEDIFSNSC
jgi:hypothetical protein